MVYDCMSGCMASVTSGGDRDCEEDTKAEQEKPGFVLFHRGQHTGGGKEEACGYHRDVRVQAAGVANAEALG